MTEITDFGLLPSYVLNYNTGGQISFPSVGLLLPKQISLHSDYLYCKAV